MSVSEPVFHTPPLPPGVLLAIVGAFHLALLAAGMSLQEAQEDGWVLKPAVRPCSGELRMGSVGSAVGWRNGRGAGYVQTGIGGACRAMLHAEPADGMSVVRAPG